MTVREMIAKVLFRADGLPKVERNMAQVKRQTRAASRAAWALKKDLKGIAIGVKTMVAAVVAGRIAKVFTSDFAKSTDEAIKFSKALGISLESYLGLTHAVRLSGGDVADMQKALGQLSKRALEVTQGNKKIEESFGDVKVTDFHGKLKSTDKLMLEVADRFKGMKDESQRTGLAMQLFGRTGLKLIPMFLEGSKGIKKMMIEAKALGIVLSRDQAKIAENYNDEMLRAKSILIAFRNVIALRVLPSITKNVRAFQLWAREGDNLQRMIDRLIATVKALAIAFGLVGAIKFAQTLMVVAGAAKKAALWVSIMGARTAMATTVALYWVAAIAALGLVIQDLYVYAKGGTSAVGTLLERFAPAEKIRRVLNGIGDGLKRLRDDALQLGREAIPVVVAVMRKLIPIGVKLAKAWWSIQKVFMDLARVLWREFGPALTELGLALVDLFNELWPVIESGARQSLSAMQELGEGILALWRAVWPEVKAAAQAAHGLMIALVELLRAAWAKIRPELVAIGKALGDLWVTAKPAVTEIIKASLRMSKIMLNLAKEALPGLGKAFKFTFKGIAFIITSSIKHLTMLVKMVTAIASKLSEAYNTMLALTGMQDVGPSGVGAAAKLAQGQASAMNPAAVLRRAQTMQQTNSFTIGSVPITVNGSNLGPEELKTATQEALQGVITETFESFKPVWG